MEMLDNTHDTNGKRYRLIVPALPFRSMKGDFAMAENNKPIHQVRIGRIKAAVFDNGDDAPLLAKVADQVHTYLYEQNGSSAG